MTPISVRRLSDGEELVLVEGRGSWISSYADPRQSLAERRNEIQSSVAAFAPGAAAVTPARSRGVE